MDKVLMQWWEIFCALMMPMLKGCFLGSFHIVLFFAGLIFIGPYITSVRAFVTNFDSILLDNDRMKAFAEGRVAIITLIVAICFLFWAINRMICKLKSQDEQLVVTRTQEEIISGQDKEEYYESSNRNPDFPALYREKFTKQNLDLNHYPLISPNLGLKYKKNAYMIIILTTVLLFSYMLKIKNYAFFINNTYGFIFFFAILELGYIYVIRIFIKREILLISPIIGAFEFVQSACFHNSFASSSFETFMVRMAFNITVRVIIALLLKLRQFLLNIQREDLQRHYPLAYKLFSSWKIRHVFKYEKQPRVLKFGPRINCTDEFSNEDLLLILSHITSKACMNLFRWLYIFTEVIFTTSNSEALSSVLNIKNFLVNIALMATFIAIDVLTIYFTEKLINIQLINSLLFYHYRYKNIKSRWLLNALELDESVDIRFRTIAYLDFSTQFYIVISSIMIPTVLIPFTLNVVLSYDYNTFRDISCLLCIVFAYMLFTIYKIIYGYVSQLVENFRKSEAQSFEKLESSLLLENYMIKMYDIYSEEFIVKYFIERQKEFLIMNLTKFLKKEDFKMNQGYLLDLYMKVSNNIKANVITNAKNLIVGEYADKLEKIASDLDNMIVKTTKEKILQVSTVVYHWLSLAKEVVHFRDKIKDIKNSHLDQLCQLCHTDEKLCVYEVKDFNKMITKYKIHLSGLPSTDAQWIKFYEREQLFWTYCENCLKLLDIQNFKKNLRPGQAIDYNNKMFDHAYSKHILKNIIDNGKNDKISVKTFLLDWIMKARTNLYLRDDQPGFSRYKDKINEIFQNK